MKVYCLLLIGVWMTISVHAEHDLNNRGIFGIWMSKEKVDSSLNGQSKITGSVCHNLGDYKLANVQILIFERTESGERTKIAKYNLHSNDTGYFEIVLPPGIYDLMSTDVDLSTERTDSLLIEPNVIYHASISHAIVDNEMIYYKPVIYLYSPQEISAHIRLNFDGEFIHTYPNYKDGWKVKVKENGQIECDGKTYDYLFWDGKFEPVASLNDMRAGSLVKREELVAFLETSLTQMGLNDREQQDFITFWLPKLSEYDTSLIYFATEVYEDKVPMEVTPQPDNLFRVFMVYADGSSIDMPVKPQKIESIKRGGFTLIEWGGGELVLPKL